MKTLYSVWW